MHLILTGATGLVGGAVLHRMITTPAVTKVSILSRRPVPQADGNAKIEVIIHKDYTTYPSEVLEKLKGAEGIVWAQGIGQNEVSEEVYRQITYDFPLAAAKAFSELSDPFKFVYMSGEGANLNPGMFTPFYGKVKGETERSLLELSRTSPSLKPYSLRLGAVDNTFHAEIHEFSKKKGIHKLDFVILPVFRVAYKSMITPSKDLATLSVDLAMSDGKPLEEGKGIEGEGRTISNVGLRRLAGI